MVTPEIAAQTVVGAMGQTCNQINEFSYNVLRTRGGRVGSGMGTLLEALWGYYMNQALNRGDGETAICEIGWISGHEYNDFACVRCDQPWDITSRSGEFFRIEAKSMNIRADESKGHFDEIMEHIGLWDLLLVLVWWWEPLDQVRVYPKIQDYFIGSARSIATLRDQLHLARGGTFVDRLNCPDGCDPATCKHHGEPLNASGKRERGSGPASARPSAQSAFAANFGGLVRMLKTNSDSARQELRRIRYEDLVAHQYISFIHRNYPGEEANQYLTSEWRSIAQKHGIPTKNVSIDSVIQTVRRQIPNYQNELRNLYIENTAEQMPMDLS